MSNPDAPTLLSAPPASPATAAAPALAAGPVDVAARLVICLGQADPDANVLPQAGQLAAREAMALAASLGRRGDEARAHAWLCTHLMRLGRHAELLVEAPAALARLLAPELDAERRELLRLVALSGSEIGAHDVALDAANELVRLSEGTHDDSAALSAAYGLAVCFERMGDSWQATRLLSQALQAHAEGARDTVRLSAISALSAISIGLMHSMRDVEPEEEVRAVLARGREAAERARALLTAVGDPVYEVVVLGNLGEVLMHQGEIAAAEPLLLRAHALAVQRGLQAYAQRVQVTLAQWLLVTQQPEQALAAMQALIHEAGPAMAQQTSIRAHDVAYRACRALRRHEEALVHHEAVARTERRRAMAQLRAQSQLFVTRTETQQAQWRAEQARLEAQRQRERAAEFAASAERDPLTGLGNRRHFDRRSAELLAQSQREGAQLSLALIDVDHFKSVNDSRGHAMGDRVLVDLARLLRENARAGDVLARHGGEEFVMLLPGLSAQQAAEVCERLRERVAAGEWRLDGGAMLPITISVGLAATPPYDMAVLMARADAALYAAKHAGRNRLMRG